MRCMHGPAIYFNFVLFTSQIKFKKNRPIRDKQRTPGLKYAPLEVQKAAQNLKISKYANFARNKNHEFVPLVAESLGGLGGMAVKLFGEIAGAQASSRHL
jgi:hypothetical protein